MKILFLSNKVPLNPKDGGSLAMLNMMKGLKGVGAEISLFSINTKKHFVKYETIKDDSNELFRNSEYVYLDTDIKLSKAFFNLFTSKSYNISRFDSPKVADTLRNFLKDKSFDIVQFEGLYMSMYIPILKKHLPEAKLIYRMHNLEYDVWDNLAQNASYVKAKYLKILAKRLKRYEINVIPSFDLIVPLSESDDFKLKKITNSPSFISPIGLKIPEDIKPKGNLNTLFFIGALDWKPNLEGLLWFLNNIWKPIHKHFPELKFVIAGRNTPSEIYKYNKVHNIEVIGEVASASQFIQENDVMLVPILSGSGVRVKVLEGLKHGKCIISTSKGVEGIKIKHKEHYLEANNTDEFIQAFTLLKSVKYRKKLQITSKKYAIENYDYLMISKRLYRFYSDFLNFNFC